MSAQVSAECNLKQTHRVVSLEDLRKVNSKSIGTVLVGWREKADQVKVKIAVLSALDPVSVARLQQGELDLTSGLKVIAKVLLLFGASRSGVRVKVCSTQSSATA